jgi:hypothetical protein
MDMNSLVDVRDLLPSVRVPTLVVHRDEDPMFPVEEGRYLADRIPGARFVALTGADHFVSGDPAQILDAVEPFIRSTPAPMHHLALAAVAHPAGREAPALTDALVAAGGRKRHSAAGDVVVLFDGPATAVRAGRTALAQAPDAALGLAVAEVADGGPVAGPGVDLAVRLGAHAAPGELLVTRMATVLLSGSGIDLEPAPPLSEADLFRVSDTVPG